jgi:UDP-2,3-diacylglucosamine hydrolase
VGNRDFALGQKFLDQFQGILLPDCYVLEINQLKFRLEHGDALCTDDIGYQRFKKVIRNPIVLGFLRKTPLSFRTKLANSFRKKSHAAQEFKSYEVMDVNQQAVAQALTNVDILIHGHTHRAGIHEPEGKKRIVLGDWKEDSAQILVIDSIQQNLRLKLSNFNY